MKVRPVLPGPLYRRVPTISSTESPAALCTEKTVEKTRIPLIRLTTLLKNGVMEPSLTAPWERFMNVANVRKVPRPAPKENFTVFEPATLASGYMLDSL